jgi:hypothetical protein
MAAQSNVQLKIVNQDRRQLLNLCAGRDGSCKMAHAGRRVKPVAKIMGWVQN